MQLDLIVEISLNFAFQRASCLRLSKVQYSPFCEEISCFELMWTNVQLIVIQRWQWCSWGTNVIWRISGRWALRKDKALQKQKVCFSWKPLPWTLQTLRQLLRWLFEIYITMSAGRSSTRIPTRQNYLSTGWAFLIMGPPPQSKTKAIFLAVQGDFCSQFQLVHQSLC